MRLATKPSSSRAPVTILAFLFVALISYLLLAQAHERQPHPTVAMDQQSIDLRRVPHNSIHTQQVIFSAKAQDNRTSTAINFEYQSPASVPPAYLRVKEDGQPILLALIAHPLLNSLDWASISDPQGVQLFQKDPTYDSVSTAIASHLPTGQIAADSVAAAKIGLASTEYTSLDSLKSLDGITVILTSFTKPVRDGSWSMFHGVYDLTRADVTNSHEIQGSIQFVTTEVDHAPFLLSPVHFDYREPFTSK